MLIPKTGTQTIQLVSWLALETSGIVLIELYQYMAQDIWNCL